MALTFRMLVEAGLPGFATKSLNRPAIDGGSANTKTMFLSPVTGLFLTRLQPSSHRAGLKPGQREAS